MEPTGAGIRGMGEAMTPLSQDFTRNSTRLGAVCLPPRLPLNSAAPGVYLVPRGTDRLSMSTQSQ